MPITDTRLPSCRERTCAPVCGNLPLGRTGVMNVRPGTGRRGTLRKRGRTLRRLFSSADSRNVVIPRVTENAPVPPYADSGGFELRWRTAVPLFEETGVSTPTMARIPDPRMPDRPVRANRGTTNTRQSLTCVLYISCANIEQSKMHDVDSWRRTAESLSRDVVIAESAHVGVAWGTEDSWASARISLRRTCQRKSVVSRPHAHT